MSENVITNRDGPLPLLNLPDLDSTVDGRDRILGHTRANSQPVTSSKPEQSHASAAKDRLRSIHARASAKMHDKLDSGSVAGESPSKGQNMQDKLTNL